MARRQYCRSGHKAGEDEQTDGEPVLLPIAEKTTQENETSDGKSKQTSSGAAPQSSNQLSQGPQRACPFVVHRVTRLADCVSQNSRNHRRIEEQGHHT